MGIKRTLCQPGAFTERQPSSPKSCSVQRFTASSSGSLTFSGSATLSQPPTTSSWAPSARGAALCSVCGFSGRPYFSRTAAISACANLSPRPAMMETFGGPPVRVYGPFFQVSGSCSMMP